MQNDSLDSCDKVMDDMWTPEEVLNNFPTIPPLLMEALEILYPDTVPDKPMKKSELAFLQGQLQVIRFLRAKFDEQQPPVIY